MIYYYYYYYYLIFNIFYTVIFLTAFTGKDLLTNIILTMRKNKEETFTEFNGNVYQIKNKYNSVSTFNESIYLNFFDLLQHVVFFVLEINSDVGKTIVSNL